MSQSKLGKLAKQQDITWSKLHRRLIHIPFEFEEMFGEKVGEFIKQKAVSLSSNVGYFTAAIMAATSFVVSLKSQVNIGTHSMPLNNYTVFVGRLVNRLQ